MNGLKITRVEVTPEACADVIETGCAAGGVYGFGYWGRIRGALRTKKGKVVAVQIMDMEGAAEGEEPKRYLVDLASVKTAIGKILRDPEGTDSHGWAARLILEDHADGPMADAIIQVACFGKIIYG